MEYQDDDHHPSILVQLVGDFFPIFLSIFFIILVGYMAGRLNVLPTGRGRSVLASFIFNIALPAGILLNMISLKLTGLDRDQSNPLLRFVIGIMIVKTTLYVLVVGVGLFLVRNSTVSWAVVFLFALATVHSNDYGIGQCLLHVLFDNSTHGPARHYPMFMDVSMLLSYISFIPTTIFFLELKRNRDLSLKLGKSICYAFLRCLLRPIVLAVIIGVILRLALHVDSEKKSLLKGFMNWFGERTLNSLIVTIPPIYLVYTGLVLVGSVRQVINPKQVIAIITVAMLKLGFSPLMLKATQRISASNKTANSSLPIMFYLYGTLPTSPILVIIASQYDHMPQTFAMIVLATTACFAPISTLFLSLNYVTSNELFSKETAQLVDTVTKSVGCLTVALAVWTLLALILLQRYRRVMYRLLFAQLMCLIAYSVLTASIEIENLNNIELARLTALGKAIASCMFCVLGCTYLFILGITDRGNTVAIDLMHSTRTVLWYILICLITPVALLALTSLLPSLKDKEIRPYDYLWDLCDNISLDFVIAKVVILVGAVILSVLPMIFSFCTSEGVRRTLDRLRYEPIEETTDVSTGLRNFHRNKMGRNNSMEGDNVETLWELIEGDEKRFQMAGIMSIVMAMMSILVEAWNLVEKNESSKAESWKAFVGIVLMYQNLWLFVGLGMAVIFGTPISELRDRILNIKDDITQCLIREEEEIILPQLELLAPETVITCRRFLQYHMEACISSIGKSIEGTFGRTYDDVFTGEDFVTWLINVGLAEDRNEAVDYGSKLVLGRVVAHIDKGRSFYDRDFFYRFVRVTLPAVNANIETIEIRDQFHVSTNSRAIPDWF